jgi:hypothetical protein
MEWKIKYLLELSSLNSINSLIAVKIKQTNKYKAKTKKYKTKETKTKRIKQNTHTHTQPKYWKRPTI